MKTVQIYSTVVTSHDGYWNFSNCSWWYDLDCLLITLAGLCRYPGIWIVLLFIYFVVVCRCTCERCMCKLSLIQLLIKTKNDWHILTNNVHTPPTTKQATNPFTRVPQPNVDASFTVCKGHRWEANVSAWDHCDWKPVVFVFTSKMVRSSLRASSPLRTDFNLSIAEGS